jgi:hypothetical protein
VCWFEVKRQNGRRQLLALLACLSALAVLIGALGSAGGAAVPSARSTVALVSRGLTGAGSGGASPASCLTTVHGVVTGPGRLLADWLPSGFHLTAGNVADPSNGVIYSLTSARPDPPRLELDLSYRSGALRPLVGGRTRATRIQVQGRPALLESGPPTPQFIGVYWKPTPNELLSVVGYKLFAAAVLDAARHVSFISPGVVDLPITPGPIVTRTQALAAVKRVVGQDGLHANAKLSSWTEIDAILQAGKANSKPVRAPGTLTSAPWLPVWAVLLAPGAGWSGTALQLVVLDAASGAVELNVPIKSTGWFTLLTDRDPRLPGCPGGSTARVPYGVLTRNEATYLAEHTRPPDVGDVTITWVVKLTTVPALNRADPGLYGGCVEQDCNLNELVWPTIEVVHAPRGQTLACLPPFATYPPSYKPKQVKQYYMISVPNNDEIGCGALPGWVAKLKDLAPLS